VWGRLSAALFFVAVCVYIGFSSEFSVLIFTIVVSIVAYLLLGVAHPARAVSVGLDWLSAIPAAKGSGGWVRTNRLAELRLDARAGHTIELRDQDGRTLSARLRELRANQLLYALFVRAVRESYRAGMRIDETAVRVLQLDMPVLGDEISVNQEGVPKVTYFAVHLTEDGSGNPISVIRRTPADPLPTDEASDGRGGWQREGYLYQFLGLPEGVAFSKISERQATAFVAASGNAEVDH
jgi:hypothetical protein